ncbi:Hypothetical_protein [Hexamita inflata]|uniref:Hypothetical_protein n=1 Tax=Hexamita inflata TaxID=28002 RepID=A0AA86TI10_9EUKA|nr:Hypothetical protein HINF_LOCUS6927 [Hexamita inflata]CAI9919284.1 Hypothetical protein HINF_LOCUS6929 [Hexamita inflata]
MYYFDRNNNQGKLFNSLNEYRYDDVKYKRNDDSFMYVKIPKGYTNLSKQNQGGNKSFGGYKRAVIQVIICSCDSINLQLRIFIINQCSIQSRSFSQYFSLNYKQNTLILIINAKIRMVTALLQVRKLQPKIHMRSQAACPIDLIIAI